MPTTYDTVPAAKRAEWRAWAASEFGPDEVSIERATDAVLSSLVAGEAVDQAIARARAAVQPAQGRASRADTEDLISDAKHLRGRVVGFRARNELMGRQYGAVWDFRVEHFDAAGNRRAPVAVEMRSLSFTGSISDGDQVEIAGPWTPGEILHPKQIWNTTMNSTVGSRTDADARPLVRLGRTVVLTLACIFAIGIFAFVVTGLLTHL